MLIIIICIIAYFVIGAFCVSKYADDFIGFHIDDDSEIVIYGALTLVWPVFMLLYVCGIIVGFFKFKNKDGRTDL